MRAQAWRMAMARAADTGQDAAEYFGCAAAGCEMLGEAHNSRPVKLDSCMAACYKPAMALPRAASSTSLRQRAYVPPGFGLCGRFFERLQTWA